MQREKTTKLISQTYLLFITLYVFVFVDFTVAATTTWTNSSGNNLWNDVNNWDNGLPSIDKDVIIDDQDATVCIGIGSHQAKSVSLSGFIDIVQNANLILSDGAGYNLSIGRYFQDNNSALNVDGGNITIVRENLVVGEYGKGTLNLKSGIVDASQAWQCFVGRRDGSSGHIQLDGGVLKVPSLVMDPEGGGTNTSSIDITAGQIILNGNKISLIEDLLARGKITGYGGQVPVVYDYNAVQNHTIVLVEQPENVQININPNEVVNSEILGLGWVVGPLWMPSDLQKREEFFNLFGEAKQSRIRVIFNYYEWEDPNNDDDNAWTSPQIFLNDSFGGFVWNGGQLHEKFRYLLDYCQNNGIDVVVIQGRCDLKLWLRPDYYADPNSYPLSYEEYLADAEEFGENLAALLYYLKVQANNGQGYDCVKYYSIWNEPGGGTFDYALDHVDYPGCLNLLHKQVHDHLIYYDQLMGTGIESQLTSLGRDGNPFFRNCPAAGHPMEIWSKMLGEGILQYLELPDGIPYEIIDWPNGDEYIDIISIHDYWGVFDYDANNPSAYKSGTIKDWLLNGQIGNSLQQITDYDIDGQIEPIVLDEIGSFAYSGENEQPSYDNSLYIAEVLVRAFQLNGVRGLTRWAWNAHAGYAAVSYPGCWYELEPLGVVHAVNEHYYPYILLTRNVEKNSNVLLTTVNGGSDDTKGTETWPISVTQRVWASAFISPAETISLVVVNDSYKAKDLMLAFGQYVPPIIDKYYVSSAQYDDLYHQEVVQIIQHAGKFNDIVSPRSINVYVTRIPGDINGDRNVDIGDLIRLVDNWLFNCEFYRPEDINGDCVVNMIDFTELAENW
jgi:hypothetical protein